MPRSPLPIAQGFYVDESLPISSQQCVNFYPHIPQTKTITDAALIGTSGISLAVTSTGIDRGAFTGGGIPQFLYGPTLGAVSYTTDAYGVRTYILTDHAGPIISGSSRVVVADNGAQLCIVAPDVTTKFNAWIYSVVSGFETISDPDFDGPVNYVCFMDGYFVFSKANSNKFFISDLRDGLTYDALDFASAESDPDDIVALKQLNGILYIFGSRTYEQWQNVGGSGFPFTKANSGSQQKGCAAPLSLVEVDGSLIWIGNSVNEKPGIWVTNGGQPEKLSTPAVDILINSGGITLLSTAYAVHWAEKGHNFIAFTVPTICTIVYDTSTQLWHERKSLDSGLNQVPWRVSSILPIFGVLLVGDNQAAKIGVMSSDVHTEYDNTISSYFTCPSIDNNGDPFTVNSVELMMETGTGPISGAGSAPVVRMAVSRDGGRLYSPEISRVMGVTGAYEQRIAWDLLGRYSRSFTAKFLIDEPIKRVVVKGEIVIGS